jgi:hypothetical protein
MAESMAVSLVDLKVDKKVVPWVESLDIDLERK